LSCTNLLWSWEGKRTICYFEFFHTVRCTLLLETDNGAEQRFGETKKVVWLEVVCWCEVWSTNISLKHFLCPPFPWNPKGQLLSSNVPMFGPLVLLIRIILKRGWLWSI